MSRIAAHARSLRKARGEFIYMPGDRADFVYILKQGRVKLSVLSESGKEIAIDIIQPGEIFGEFALVDESLRSNMAQALDDMLDVGLLQARLYATPHDSAEAGSELHPARRRSPAAHGEEAFRHHFEGRVGARLRTAARAFHERGRS